MLEFTTYEDVTTIMAYIRGEMDKVGNYSDIIIDIEAIAYVYEVNSKLVAMLLLDDVLTREV